MIFDLSCYYQDNICWQVTPIQQTWKKYKVTEWVCFRKRWATKCGISNYTWIYWWQWVFMLAGAPSVAQHHLKWKMHNSMTSNIWDNAQITFHLPWQFFHSTSQLLLMSGAWFYHKASVTIVNGSCLISAGDAPPQEWSSNSGARAWRDVRWKRGRELCGSSDQSQSRQLCLTAASQKPQSQLLR